MTQDDDETFLVFWSCYPRRQAKGEAQKAWQQLQPSPELVAEILEALARHVRTKQWLAGVVPHAATWLRGRRWEDELRYDDFPHAKL